MSELTSSDIIRVPNTLVFSEVERCLAEGKSVRLRAVGNSMLPFIVGGRDDVILRKPHVGHLLDGEIVLARLSSGEHILHRVYSSDEDSLVLMGDGNRRTREHCRASDVLGVVTMIVRRGKEVDCSARGERFKVRLWRCLLPIRRYLLYIYKRLW